MTHSHHPGILARWKLKINWKNYIEVFIWQDKESMYAADDYNTSFMAFSHCPKEHNYAGFARAIGWAERVNKKGETIGIGKSARKFGEIHLANGFYGSKVASHEIAHIVNYWGKIKNWNPYGKDDENSARLTGILTGQFWLHHYEVFKP